MFDAFAFSQHPNRLIDIWRKNSVNIKPGFITDDYRGFTLFFRQLNGRGDGLRGSRRMRNNLNQRHFFDRAKKVQSNHLFRSGRIRRNIANRQGRSIGGKNGVSSAILLHFRHHLLF